jgi:tRNA threonylcarbamoyl adenosine modification protein (Sua5/YciO/YrdC/YwlC family)
MIILKPDRAGINQAVAILKKGGVIVYPTDTAYALGGFFDSKKVTQKILKIKNRKDKKFTIIAANLNQVKAHFSFNIQQENLAKKYWPGALSIIVSKRVAVRVPRNRVALLLAERTGRPLIATSANITGQKTLYWDQAIIKQFKNKKNRPNLILAAGRLPKVKTSTVVKVLPNKLEIIRPGKIKL